MPVIASHQHRFIFLKTRKTAGTSVEIALSKVCGPDDIITEISPEDEALRQAAGGRAPQNFESPPLPRKAYNHMGAKRPRPGGAGFADYFTFAIERNPWDAVVSLYFWKYKDRPELPDFETYVQEIWIEQLANNRRLYRIRGRWRSTGCCATSTSTPSSTRSGSSSACPAARPAARQGQRPPGRALPRALHRRLAQRVATCSPTPSRPSATSSDVRPGEVISRARCARWLSHR